ncbi:diacylglycerol kinase family protein [Kribbella sp. NBC_01484]|uniref:diacylglycerol kinase family protein n=1 Tax=Kribbella sp. NBC_01484 TaxID=2903579 RepID=UPI002E37AF8C|nr:diacylglycerol kinase family protein [Kribbella sp. NBC_01484]
MTHDSTSELPTPRRGAGEGTSPALADPIALIRSREYHRLLVVAALIGVVVSLVSWGYLELVHALQQWLYVDLPRNLGYDTKPWWWPLPILTVAGFAIAFAVIRLPGHGGHEPSEGLRTSPPTQPTEVPGVLLAALATLGLGLVLGPEAPLIAIGTGVALLLMNLSRRDIPDQARLVIGAAGAFAALATIFGSPVIGAVIIIEAAGLGGSTLPLVLLPGLLAAGIGSLVFVGVGALTGLSSDAWALPPLKLATYPTPQLSDFGWTVALALVAALLVYLVMELARRTRTVAARQAWILIPAAVLVGLVAIAFAEISGETADTVLFSGQEAMSLVVRQGAIASLGTLALLLVCKGNRLGTVDGRRPRGPDISSHLPRAGRRTVSGTPARTRRDPRRRRPDRRGSGLRAACPAVGDQAALSVVGVIAVLAGGYWFLANRGVLRWLALGLVIAAPVLIVVAFVSNQLLWVAVVALALMVAAAATARAALGTDGQDEGTLTVAAARPRRPFVIMNPRSGGGKVTKFGLKDKAEKLGAEVALLEGPGMVDVAALARQAVADGADLLGVAGGDGTQALVAGIAAEHDLPFLVVSAGTRNHFALDLGLDREDPAACLDGLTDGEELRVDLGVIADRTFVNNASFGVYAEVVQSPAYRDDKRGTTLQMRPDLLRGHQGAHVTAQAAGTTIDDPQALLVSNDPYGMGDVAGLGRRARLDAGPLGVVGIRAQNALQAAELIRRGHGTGLTVLTAGQVTVDADAPEIPVGIDGETVMLPTPVRCTIRPGALRVVVPRERPGVPAPEPPLDWPRLRQLASFRHLPDSQLVPTHGR